MGRRAVVWAVSGPSEGARQWPMTTNDDHQAYEPTAPEQRKPSSPRSPARPRARRSKTMSIGPLAGGFTPWDLFATRGCLRAVG